MRDRDPAWVPDAATLLTHVGRVARYPYYKLQLIRYLARLLPDGPLRLLDVGAGDGSLGSTIQRFRPMTEVVGVETFVREGRWRFPDATLVCYDGVTLPFKDASFDCSLVSNVLHHVGGVAAQAGLLTEVHRVTRERIIIKDHLANSTLHRLQLAMLDILGNRRFGASTTGTYLSDASWDRVFATLESRVAHRHTQLSFRRGPLAWIFSNDLEIIFTLDHARHP